jgi:hypothetical protein
MARSSYIILNSADEEAYYSALRPTDRFIHSAISRKVALMSVRRKKGVSQKSLLPVCSLAWSGLTSFEKLSWKTAGAYTKLTNWRLFVKDYCYRVINGLPGIATPVIQHQGLVGQLHIEAPGDELKIEQPHPSDYYVSKKVTGTKSMYSPVLVYEVLSLPFKIGLSYKSNLIKTEYDGFAKFYAIVRRLYQGQNLEEILEIDLDLISDWQIASNILYGVLGQYTSYTLYFHLYHLTGDLLIDNIIAEHDNINYARDKDCNDIHQDFTRAFYQVPAHWSAIIIPYGAFFESVYPE